MADLATLKTPILLDRQRLFDPSKRLPIETTLKVEIYTGEGWDLDFPRAHFDQYSPPDIFITIGIAGVPRDTVYYRTETVVEQWFPIWREEFLFQLSVPELALVWFRVQDYEKYTRTMISQERHVFHSLNSSTELEPSVFMIDQESLTRTLDFSSASASTLLTCSTCCYQ